MQGSSRVQTSSELLKHAGTQSQDTPALRQCSSTTACCAPAFIHFVHTSLSSAEALHLLPPPCAAACMRMQREGVSVLLCCAHRVAVPFT